jgi:hypothetical protein
LIGFGIFSLVSLPGELATADKLDQIAETSKQNILKLEQEQRARGEQFQPYEETDTYRVTENLEKMADVMTAVRIVQPAPLLAGGVWLFVLHRKRKYARTTR